MGKPEDDARKALLERAQALLSTDASPAAKKNIKSNLESLAATLLLEWLVGDKRFESQSQQTEYWLSRFYDGVFVDEQPDATRIYERFGVNLPRAGYLARLLRARRAAQWRQAARAELKTQLERYKDRAAEAKKEGQGHVTEFDVSLSPGAADEMRVVYDRLAAFVAERERPKPPKAKPSFGNSRWLGVPAETLLSILEALKTGDGT
ncbi:hypothetical protein CT676_27835 [Bradyrhizobium sp. MOS001]|uniref:hypothetical protein n=1 Tax=Bradyrhizobium sp. MOS001 TaxID=2133948 RepID=UPI0010754AB0|nr:hypothetical protein [Bradyrhizobium sp. MOS001]TFW57817.1 hypothetical protein CT676_27835 [Bradyrhizobium sp. MOS001]